MAQESRHPRDRQSLLKSMKTYGREAVHAIFKEAYKNKVADPKILRWSAMKD